eukprot:scaffold403_cov157-Amphora_coffeaeformis.AAC.5
MTVGSTCAIFVTDETTLPPGSLEKEPFNKNMTGEPERKAPKVVFETPSKYDSFVVIILSICLLSILFAFYKVYGDDNISDDERKQAYTTLIWTPVSISLVFALVLPHSLQVRSDSSLGIRTLFVTWWFSEVTETVVNPPFSEHCRRPRYKFATALFRHHVLVRRREGHWDVLVSPRDVDAFVQAIANVSSESGYITTEA